MTKGGWLMRKKGRRKAKRSWRVRRDEDGEEEEDGEETKEEREETY